MTPSPPATTCYVTACEVCGHTVSARTEQALFDALMDHQDAKHA